MAKTSMKGSGQVQQIAEMLCAKIQDSAMSCELVDWVKRPVSGGEVHVMVFEKYYMRASNRAGLTVVVSGCDSDVVVDAIGSAGGNGPLLKWSWGAEEDFADVIIDILRPLGFEIFSAEE